jgi:hypothetical protein
MVLQNFLHESLTFHFYMTLKQFIFTEFTERHGRVVNIPASYLGDPGFKSRPGDRLY